MKITSYNHHAKAPSSPGALVLKPRLPGRSSLRSYPINPDVALFADVRVGLHEDLILLVTGTVATGSVRDAPGLYHVFTSLVPHPPPPWSPGIIELAGIFGLGL